MEITVSNQKYIFKETLSVDEFLAVGFPPLTAYKGGDKLNNTEYLELVRYQKRLLASLCVDPKDKNHFGTVDLGVFNTIVTHKKFLTLFQNLFAIRNVDGEIPSGEEAKHLPKPITI